MSRYYFQDRLLSYSNVITRILNSSRRVRTEEFKDYVKEAYVYHTTVFDFYWPTNDSVHRMWAHCIQRIEKLYGFSLGLQSEGPLERQVCLYELGYRALASAYQTNHLIIHYQMLFINLIFHKTCMA